MKATPTAVEVVSMAGLGAAELLPLSRQVGGWGLQNSTHKRRSSAHTELLAKLVTGRAARAGGRGGGGG